MSEQRVQRSPRPNVLYRRAVRRTWGSDPLEVVVLAVLREPAPPGSAGRQHAIAVGVRDGRAVVVDRAEDVELLRRRPTTVRLADGTEWQPGRIGCSCHVPAQLRGVDPTRVP